MDTYRNAIQTCAGSSGLVWIAMINNGYVEYTKNFLKAMDVYGSACTILIYCLDAESLAALSTERHCIALDASVFLKKKYTSSLSIWATYSYKEMMFAKLDAMKFTIQHARSLGIPFVGYLDTDIILLSNPTADATSCMNEHPSVQVVALCDEPTPACTNQSACKNLCAGTMVFRVKGLNDSMFEYTSRNIDTMHSDQELLVKNFKDMNIVTRSIKKPIWMNGAYPGVKGGTKMTVPSGTNLIHFNYIVDRNYAKREAMKVHGMWFV